ncbi:MAG: sugar ABC transporter permease [Clostridia bacterium]|nr:sugar ABC transporter permease [Clostridia bacterium]
MLKKMKPREWLLQIAFTGPAIFFFLIIMLIPFFMGMYYSLTDWNGVSDSKTFVGLSNFGKIIQDESFLASFWFTIRFSVASVLISNVLAFVLALILTSNVFFRNILRTIFFVPNVISGLLLGFIWQFVFIKGFETIGNATGIGLFLLPWLGTEATGFWGTVIVFVWQFAGYLMVIYIAGITNNVPKELMEAADIDGASYWQRLRSIIVPMIMPSITVSLFLSLSQAFKMFDLNFSLTNGGPFNSTKSVALDIFFEAFQSNNFGLGSAKAFVFFMVVATITIFQVWATKRKEIQV